MGVEGALGAGTPRILTVLFSGGRFKVMCKRLSVTAELEKYVMPHTEVRHPAARTPSMARQIPAFPPLPPQGQALPPQGQAMAGMTVLVENTSV